MRKKITILSKCNSFTCIWCLPWILLFENFYNQSLCHRQLMVLLCSVLIMFVDSIVKILF